MTNELNIIEQQARSLSVAEREELIVFLASGLENEPLTDIDRAWVEEAERRYDDLISGRVKGISAHDAIEEIRRDLQCGK